MATPSNPMMSLDAAKSMMLDKIAPSTAQELVLLEACLGRVLAQDIKSPLNMPPFDNSAMDGYALTANDLSEVETLSVVGTSFAGAPYIGDVNKGECVRIMTGAKMPSGCDSVIMQELVTVSGQNISVKNNVKVGQCVRHCGEEFAAGETVLTKGDVISARHIALIASLGFAKVPVIKKITVAIFSTGDELVALGDPLEEGQIYDSNRFSIIAQLQKMNMTVLDLGVIPDNPQQLNQAFEKANQHADVVVTSGGVSVGDADYTKDVLEQLGSIEFWKVAIKPGKPIAFGQLASSLFFGLPGNPVSAMVTFDQIVKPALQKLSGERHTEQLRLSAVMTNDLRKSAGRAEFQRGIATTQQGKLVVSTTGAQGSGMVGSMCKANCFIVLSREQKNVVSGESVVIELFDNNLVG